MKEVAALIAALSSKDIGLILSGTPYQVELSCGEKLDICADDLIVQREERPGMTVATESGITLALDTTLTRELEEEGFAREFVSRIQNMRKDTGLEVADRISIHYSLDSSFKSALINFSDYICAETLAETLTEDKILDKDNAEVLDINGIACLVKMRKNTSSCMKKSVEE
jgi:isoleucyl-tRNA synthetase